MATQKYDYLGVRALGPGGTHLGVSNFISTGSENGVAALVIGAWRTVVTAVVVGYMMQAI